MVQWLREQNHKRLDGVHQGAAHAHAYYYFSLHIHIGMVALLFFIQEKNIFQIVIITI